MKKNLLRSVLLIALTICGALSASAAWEVQKSWDFEEMAKAADETEMSYSTETIKFGKTTCDLGTGEFEGLAAQAAKGFRLRTKSGGLYNGNGGGRLFAVLNLTAGERVTITTNGDCFSGEENATLDSHVDNVYVYTVTADGNFAVSMTRYFALKSIVVEKNVVAEGEVYADYTIKFVNEEGTEIKDAVTRNGLVGDPVALTASDKDPIVLDDVKYVFKSDDAEGLTVAENGTVVTLTFAVAPEYTYTVKTSNPEKELANSKGYEGDVVTVCYPAYLLVDNYLTKSEPRTSKGEYNVILTLDGDVNEVVEMTDTDIKDVVFYAEAEDITTLNVATGSYAVDRCSMGKGAYASQDNVITTLAPGKYKMTVSTRGGGARDYGFVFSVNNVDVYTTATLMGYNQTGTSDEFEVPAESKLIVKKAGSNSDMIDYLYIQKTGNTSAIETIVSEAEGAAVYYNLNGIRIDNPAAGQVVIKVVNGNATKVVF